MKLTWLADALRDAGLTVVEHAGWQTHDVSGTWSPQYGVVHATAAPRSQSDETQVRIVRDGRSDLPGPIANATVDRQGRWHVLSAGRCNTTLVGTAGPFEGKGNTYALGVEACNDNAGEAWPAVQYEAYYRGWAAICRRLGWTARNLVGHKEHTPGRKTDPTFNMNDFRARVTAVLSGEDDDMAVADDVARIMSRQSDQFLQDQGDNARSDGTKYGFKQMRAELATLKANLATLAGKDFVNEQEIADAVLAGLGSRSADEIRAALKAALPDGVYAELFPQS